MADGTGPVQGDTLTVQVQGGRGESERVLVLSRPRDGLVEVREFSMGSDAPRDYTATADEVRELFERASRQRRRISEDLYAIRRWLGDAGVGGGRD